MIDFSKKDWWKEAVIYQIYPKSFQDSKGTASVTCRASCPGWTTCKSWGVNALWISPVFASPQVDNGYDVSDYRAIDPMFGTMEDMRTLIREAGGPGHRHPAGSGAQPHQRPAPLVSGGLQGPG